MARENDDPKPKRFKPTMGSVRPSEVNLPKTSLKARILETTNNENCLSCKRFRSCDDPNKAFNYLCHRYKSKELMDLASFSIDRQEDTTKAEHKPKKVKNTLARA